MDVSGTIRISRVFSNAENGDYVMIEIRDEVSGVHFFRGRMTLEDYANSSFGSDRPIQGTFQGADRIGAVREHKTVFVPDVRGGYRCDKATAQAAVATFEVEGWRASLEDFGNSHKSRTENGQKGYMVSFRRHVRNGVPIDG